MKFKVYTESGADSPFYEVEAPHWETSKDPEDGLHFFYRDDKGRQVIVAMFHVWAPTHSLIVTTRTSRDKECRYQQS